MAFTEGIFFVLRRHPGPRFARIKFGRGLDLIHETIGLSPE